MRTATMTLALAALLAASTGCAYKVRNVTAGQWAPEGNGNYVAYWEGTCMFGCDVGDGKVVFCKLNPADNGLTCVPQESVNALLDKKAR